MPETKRPLKVFLCHAHADRDAVRGLYSRLTQDGVDAWLDKAKLLPGQDWELEIRKAVREADVVVVCLSKQFNQAGFRQKEVRLALDTAMEKPEGEIFIIPARLEECDNLESLRKWHWVDLFEEDGYEMLMRALQARADRIRATLQIKKSWLPIGNTQSAVVKKPFPPVEKPVEKKQEGPKSKKETQPPKSFNRNVIGIVGFVVLVLALIFGLPSLIGEPEEATPAVTNAAGFETFTPIPAYETEPPFTPTPQWPTEITDSKGVDMVLVPVGQFTMGNDNGNADEKPAHEVYLFNYYIDKFEVTNALYRACVDVGECRLWVRSPMRPNYYNNSEFDNYPMIEVDWDMAKTYCEWRQTRLPSEAEWEKAARGTDGRTYPWGEGLDCSRANYRNGDAYCVGNTTAVGIYESGKSVYGVYDLIGNVNEWVNDLYSETYYDTLPAPNTNIATTNPLGPETGSSRVLRGGSWSSYVYQVNSTVRASKIPYGYSSNDIGFRCVQSY